MRALAIVCFRNERVHLRRCLSDLIGGGIDVAAIDHASDDGSLELASSFLGRGLVRLEHLPWNGCFSLSEQLRIKRQMIAEATDYQWIIHVDADERLCSPQLGQSLLHGIEEADAAGATCVNFHEMVFVPLPGEDFENEDYADQMNTYYFFEPKYPRLNRAWKRSAELDNSSSGGHALTGSKVLIHNKDFFLRHYLALSETHAKRKYVGRKFSDEDLTRGWHGNRTIIRAENLKVKTCTYIKRLSHPFSADFDLSSSAKTHFWQW